jgi:hypothetical protein
VTARELTRPAADPPPDEGEWLIDSTDNVGED